MFGEDAEIFGFAGRGGSAEEGTDLSFVHPLAEFGNVGRGDLGVAGFGDLGVALFVTTDGADGHGESEGGTAKKGEEAGFHNSLVQCFRWGRI